MPAPETLTPVTATGTTPPTVTLSGDPSPFVTTLHVDIVGAGVRGVSTFRWSSDNGVTWQPTVATAATAALAGTGITVAFAAGAYAADNLYRADALGFDAGDPALSIILKFLQAFLNDNALTAWQAVAPGLKVVATTWPDKPPASFNAKNLPALFGFRTGEPKEEWVGDGILVSTAEITALWVMPWAQQETQRRRINFRNAIGRLVNVGIERGRTPGYVVTSQTIPSSPDYDPIAAAQGSLVYPLLGAWSLNYIKSKPTSFVDEMPGNDSQTFDALEMTLELREKLTIGLDKYTTLNGIDVTITNPVQIVDHRTLPTIPASVADLAVLPSFGPAFQPDNSNVAPAFGLSG